MDPRALDFRKQQVLKAVVSDYTETGVPVGSQSLVARALSSWSAATIRNELANLVEIGYLLQPHTSAGRIPSDRGYRYFVDFLMEEEAIPVAVRRQVDPQIPRRPSTLDEVLEAAALALALITDSVSMVTAPRTSLLTLKHLDLVSLEPTRALLIIVLEGNLIRQQVIELSVPADQAELSELARRVDGELRGLDAQAIAVHAGRPGGADALRSEVLSHLLAFMRSADARSDAVVLHDGVRNLLHQPEFGDVEQLERVLAVVEEGARLGAVLTALEVGQGVQVIIGSENAAPELHGCSLVLTAYRTGDTARGTIGVLGPTRMRYGQVAPRLRYVSRRMGEALDRMLG